MSAEKTWLDKIAFIAALVEKAPRQTLGRTALMKLAYFLQVLKNVPLGYDFGLHTYGPFDTDVLDDLSYAQVFGAVTEKTILQRDGYRYEIRPGKRCMKAQKTSRDWLDQHGTALDWVLQEFGSLNAPDLELYSTIVFVDRENATQAKSVSLEHLAEQVRNVKPRFTHSQVLHKCREADAKGFLLAISTDSSR
jgi:uncharacterized protein YwgA